MIGEMVKKLINYFYYGKNLRRIRFLETTSENIKKILSALEDARKEGNNHTGLTLQKISEATGLTKSAVYIALPYLIDSGAVRGYGGHNVNYWKHLTLVLNVEEPFKHFRSKLEKIE